MMDSKAIETYIKLAERVSKPTKLDEWKGRADALALSCKNSMAVVAIDGHYQIWSAQRAGSDSVYIAEYAGGNDNG